MSRRDFLRMLAIGAAACAAPRPRSSGTPRIRAVAFDLFTCLDPRTIDRAAEAIVPGRGGELADAWRTRQFQYSWLRLGAEQYRDFWQLTEDALDYALRARSIELAATERARLLQTYRALDPWADTARVLGALRSRGLRLAPLANFTPSMIADVLAHAGLTKLFDDQISTDVARTYKPSPRAYQLAVERFGLAREEIAFAAFGGWDAAGASWFGFPTFWVNRFGVTPEALDAPAATGPDLEALARWLG
jgi:2-haloacid dehalogenase